MHAAGGRARKFHALLHLELTLRLRPKCAGVGPQPDPISQVRAQRGGRARAAAAGAAGGVRVGLRRLRRLDVAQVRSGQRAQRVQRLGQR